VRAADVRRAKLILMLEDGESRDSTMRTLGCDSRFIARWSGRLLKDLDRRLMHFIREHTKNPKPIKWKYYDPSRRIRPVATQ